MVYDVFEADTEAEIYLSNNPIQYEIIFHGMFIDNKYESTYSLLSNIAKCYFDKDFYIQYTYNTNTQILKFSSNIKIYNLNIYGY